MNMVRCSSRNVPNLPCVTNTVLLLLAPLGRWYLHPTINLIRIMFYQTNSGTRSHHAEDMCLRHYKGDKKFLKKCTMIIVRVAKDNNGDVYFSRSVPCDNCTKILNKSKIKRVLYKEGY